MTPGAGSGGLVAVHAHPDDETLWTGALLATWSRSGRPVTVVTCTRGEQGEVLGPDQHLAGDPAGLARHRLGELAGALAALGVADHAFLDELGGGDRWVDSGMVWGPDGRAMIGPDVPAGAFARADVGLAATGLAALLRARRPDAVVGYEPGGGYGHPDHVQAHRVMMRAVRLAADDVDGVPGWEVPCVLWAAQDGDALVQGRQSCAARVPAGLVSSVGSPLPSAAVPPDEVDVLVDVAPVLDPLLEALRAHVTQVQAAKAVVLPGVVAQYALSGGLLEPVLATESYRLAPGSDASAVRWPQGVRVP
ncbi:PIG-L family deacetylase [Actinotalea sp. M2MS4P-6]|uniref:PIG-L family deacetylase n=1 Tax=Actinotalea sp. M2MS4P-6 TaxID=2983762 RepID=UPI0021E47927|nr:PIG-L family deacetylase [Actinotalea sp. M2MS4P-6]MCV2396417.1 PIG-L family deacetylase [Actinotalea sp. M2MS4P-6]